MFLSASSPSHTHLHTKLMFYCISIKETWNILKFVVWYRNVFRKISQNIKKKSKIFLTFEKSKKIYHFCAKNCPNGYIDRNMVKFSPKTTEHYQHFLTPFLLFQFFSEPTLSKICSFKSLSGAYYWRWKKLKSRRCYIISYIPIIKKEMVLDI